jgi:hypothetical protein
MQLAAGQPSLTEQIRQLKAEKGLIVAAKTAAAKQLKQKERKLRKITQKLKMSALMICERSARK